MIHSRRLAAALALAGAGVVTAATPAAAHALGGRSDLPLPLWLFAYGAGTAVVISFAALGLLWPSSRFERPIEGWPLPRPVLAAPVVAVVLRVFGLAAFLGVFLSALFGGRDPPCWPTPGGSTRPSSCSCPWPSSSRSSG